MSTEPTDRCRRATPPAPRSVPYNFGCREAASLGGEFGVPLWGAGDYIPKKSNHVDWMHDDRIASVEY